MVPRLTSTICAQNRRAMYGGYPATLILTRLALVLNGRPRSATLAPAVSTSTQHPMGERLAPTWTISLLNIPRCSHQPGRRLRPATPATRIILTGRAGGSRWTCQALTWRPSYPRFRNGAGSLATWQRLKCWSTLMKMIPYEEGKCIVKLSLMRKSLAR